VGVRARRLLNLTDDSPSRVKGECSVFGVRLARQAHAIQLNSRLVNKMPFNNLLFNNMLINNMLFNNMGIA
jgi:hypothetical protein